MRKINNPFPGWLDENIGGSIAGLPRRQPSPSPHLKIFLENFAYEYSPCLECNRVHELHHDDFFLVEGGIICEACVVSEAYKHDASVWPMSSQNRSYLERHMLYREARAIAKFYLESRGA